MNKLAIRVWALAHKEALHLVRDQQAIYLALGMPVLLVLLFGYAVSFDLDRVDLAVIDQDRTAESRDLVRSLEGSTVFDVRVELDDARALEPLLRRGRVQGAIAIPRGHARSLLRGEHAKVQLLMDGSDGTSTQVALGYALAVAQSKGLASLRRAFSGGLPLEPRVRTWFNPQMRSAMFVVPGLVGVVLAILATLLSALTIAREWERGSMEQLFSTPVGRLPVILGKLLPYVALGVVQLLLVLTAGVWLFDVPFLGSFFLLLGAAILFLFCTLGQGLLISTIAKNQQVATQIAAVSGILPSLLLSGFLFPIHNMPIALQWVSRIVAARYLLPVLRGVMLQGRTTSDLWPELVGLLVLAVVIIGASTARFQRRLD